MNMMYKERLQQLRQILPEGAGFLLPRTDAFQGEYIRPCDERLKWLTGFTGSAGMCYVQDNKATLFVDGRYTLQARQQVDTSLFDIVDVTKVPLSEFLSGNTVAFDPWLITLKQRDTYKSKGIELKYIDNPIDKLWKEGRPVASAGQAYPHELKFSGEAYQNKISMILRDLDKEYDAVLLTKPESVNWLLNIRGDDIPHTPIVLCYAVVYKDGSVDLLLEAERIPQDIDVRATTLDELPQRLKDKSVITDFSVTPVWFEHNLKDTFFTHADDPCALPKACKNEVELAGARLAHLKDGTAVCSTLAKAKEFQDELDIIARLEENRAKQENFKDSSFDTIAGINENGAIIHYRATSETNRKATHNCMILIDSGGQYLEGTTDITRTICLGEPTQQQRFHYTLVLKGLIALSSAKWPKGLTGRDIDAFARAALWQEGLDYAHGTGHGVGAFLSVHEGPQGISKRSEVALESGMIVSIEPGFYLEGEYGIRLENLAIITPSEHTDFLCFETLTRCPFDKRLIDKDILTKHELQWINNYHKKVFDAINPRISMMDAVWLSESCAALS
jgi:Xaa-Pro aminopeptidase